MYKPNFIYEYVEEKEPIGKLDRAFNLLFEEMIKIAQVENPDLLKLMGISGSLTLSGGVRLANP
jgi:hypothetical protein